MAQEQAVQIAIGTPWWAAAVGAAVGVLLALGFGWVRRKRQLRAGWRALKAEVEFCHKIGKAYLGAGVGQPATRAPRVIYDENITSIVTEGDLSTEEAHHLMAFYVNVDEFNRVLDFAAKAYQDGNNEWRKEEVGRAELKAKHFLPGDKGDVYTPAMQVIDPHLAHLNKLCYRCVLWIPA